jgi:hypothetical protein
MKYMISSFHFFSFPSGHMADLFQISKTKIFISNFKTNFFEMFSFQISFGGINEIFSFPSGGTANFFSKFQK